MMKMSRMVMSVALAGMMVGLFGCGQQAAVQAQDRQEKIAIAGAKATPKQEAVAADKLQNRAGVVYIVNGQEPYSGLAQAFYDNGQMQWEAGIKDGKVIALKRWHENGVLAMSCGFTTGRLEDITMEGSDILERRSDFLDGAFVEYDHDARQTRSVIFKNGELQSIGLRFKVKADVLKIASDIRSGDGGAGLSNIELDAHVKDALEGALDRSVEVLHNRLKRLGIEAPSVIKRDGMLEIQLPGVGEDKRDEVKRLILSVGFLEFRMVHERSQDLTDRLFAAGKAPAGWKSVTLEGRFYYRMADEIPSATRDAAFLQEQGRFENPDPRYEFLLEEVEVQGQQVHRPYFVNRNAVLRSRDVHNACLESTGLNQPAVGLVLTPQGATRFGEITEQYAPGGSLNPSGERQLAIVIDGILYSAPTIREPIHSGRIQIPVTGLDEAKHLVNILSSGALPIQLNIE